MCAVCDQRAEAADKEAMAEQFPDECRRKIADWNWEQMGDQSDWDRHGRNTYDLVDAMATRIELLMSAARLIDEYAWTAVKADCRESERELNRRISILRAALCGVSLTALTTQQSRTALETK